jgi:hypothetical protein
MAGLEQDIAVAARAEFDQSALKDPANDQEQVRVLDELRIGDCLPNLREDWRPASLSSLPSILT